jgi:hypothetical protein
MDSGVRRDDVLMKIGRYDSAVIASEARRVD